MVLSRDEIFDAACELPVYDRNHLAGLLSDSLPADEEVERAIGEEAHRRYLQIQREEIEGGVPGEQFLEELWARRTPASQALDDEILPEYSPERAVPEKNAGRYGRDAVVVLLEPDVAEVFPDDESVNRALRALTQIIQEQASKTAA